MDPSRDKSGLYRSLRLVPQEERLARLWHAAMINKLELLNRPDISIGVISGEAVASSHRAGGPQERS